MRIDDFLAKLDGVKETASGYSAKCPGHPDTVNSLRVSADHEGRIDIKDFGGCTQEAIVAAMGLRLSDLFGPGGNGHRPGLVRPARPPGPLPAKPIARPIPEAKTTTSATATAGTGGAGHNGDGTITATMERPELEPALCMNPAMAEAVRRLRALGLTEDEIRGAILENPPDVLLKRIGLAESGDFDRDVTAHFLLEFPFDEPETEQIALGAEAAAPAREPEPKPVLAPEAYHGLAGEIVKAVEPYTEADPAAILSNILGRFGVGTGSGPHFYVGDTRHAANENILIVGQTSASRKGTSESTPKRLFNEADPDFSKRVMSGLSSGEGLIHAVRDERREQEPIKEKGRVVGYQEVVVDPGVEDKRLLAVESEFAQTLAVLAREGNTLGPVLRNAWDGSRLSTLTKNNGETATDAHIGIFTHITRHELLRKLSEGDAFNGFLNRFIIIEVSRSKLLPEGARLPEGVALDLSRRLASALDKARRVGTMRRDDEARDFWATAYTELERPQPGLYGALRARGSAHVLRFSMIYALMDGEGIIRVPHIEAALAVWDYCEASIRRIFGDRTGDSVADRIIETLHAGPATANDLIDVFGRNVKAARLKEAIVLLQEAGRIEAVKVETGGRPATEYRLTR